MLKIIKSYQDAGYITFPVSKTKIPLVKNWQALKQCVPININTQNAGIQLTKNHLVVDADPRNYQNKINSLDYLIEVFKIDISATFCVKTMSGGFHIYFKKPADISIKKNHKQFPGIDFLSKGAYVVSAGSTTPKGNYTILCGDIKNLADAPAGLLEVIRRKNREEVKQDAKPTLNHIHDYIAWLYKQEGAKEGQAGDAKTFQIVAKGRDWGLPEGAVFEAVLKHYNPICEPMWSYDELKNKVDNVYKYAKNLLGVSAPENLFSNVDTVKKIKLRWDRQENGKLKNKSFLNTCSLFKDPSKDLFQLLRYNEFTHEIELTKKPSWLQVESTNIKSLRWDDSIALQVRYWLEVELGYSTTHSQVHEAAITVSRDNGYHPIKGYLDGLIWDGVKRLDTWLTGYAGVPENVYTKDISRKVLTAMVARIYEAGTKFDHMLILEGKQAVGKSTLCSILGGKYYGELTCDVSSTTQTIEALQNKWVVEFTELDSFRSSSISSLKAFITRQVDSARLAYARSVSVVPRQNIFIGTVNPTKNGYLKDVTGNRRYWIVKVKQIDFEGLRDARDQLFAEAKELWFSKKEKLFLDNPKSDMMCRSIADQRMFVDSWRDYIVKYIINNDHLNTITIQTIIEDVLNISSGNIDRNKIVRIRNIMARLGYDTIESAVETYQISLDKELKPDLPF